MIKDMKIGKRWGIGFAVVALLLVIVSIVSLIRLSAIGDTVRVIVNDRMPKVSRVHDIASQMMADDGKKVESLYKNALVVITAICLTTLALMVVMAWWLTKSITRSAAAA